MSTSTISTGLSAGSTSSPSPVRSTTAGAHAPVTRDERAGAEDGMTTAEYAVGTLAACALAGVLLFVVKDGAVKDAILGVITAALSTRG